MSQLKIYFASNDVQVSEAPTETNAVEVTLRADLEESDSVRLYAKCDAGYKATGTTVVLTGASVARWEVAPDSTGSAGTYVAGSTGISLGEVTTAATYFWVKASSLNTESIQKDVTVRVRAEGIGEAV